MTFVSQLKRREYGCIGKPISGKLKWPQVARNRNRRYFPRIWRCHSVISGAFHSTGRAGFIQSQVIPLILITNQCCYVDILFLNFDVDIFSSLWSLDMWAISFLSQVLIASTQPRYQRSSTSTITDQSKNISSSQVTLPLDSQGSFDFRNYPFRVGKTPLFSLNFVKVFLGTFWYILSLQIFVINLQGKMTGFNLYGLVTDIQRDSSTAEAVFLIMLEDPTGLVIVKLHFSRQW